VSKFSAQGEPLSPPLGWQVDAERGQGLTVDAQGNVWVTSFENNRVVVLPGGDVDNPIFFQEEDTAQPFDVAMAPDGTAWVTNSASKNNGEGSSVAKFRFDGSTVERLFETPVGNSLKGLVVDSRGFAWLASGGDDKVYQIDPEGQIVGTFDGGGTDGPWGVSLDGDENVWVANFGPIEPGSVLSKGTVAKLAGSNPDTRPPGTEAGQPLSPPTGYTLPSAGSPVLLHNGDPLYGPGMPPSYVPMMRLTNVLIDRAGNAWALNNWKPDFDEDRSTNPGGDGIVIFVGLAKPVVD
jgi:streptogramin lyase